MFIQVPAQAGHFLRWAIHQQEPIYTGPGGISGKGCMTIALNRIEITHQHNGRSRIPAAEIFDCFQHTAKRYTPGNRAIAGQLNDRSVRHRIGERYAEFQQIGA